MANYFQTFLLSSFLIGFSFSPTAEISMLELEFEESLSRKTASIFKEGIGQESNRAANQEKQTFLVCQISPSASSTRDLGTRLGRLYTPYDVNCTNLHILTACRMLHILTRIAQLWSSRKNLYALVRSPDSKITNQRIIDFNNLEWKSRRKFHFIGHFKI